ncbi:hypothetical protein MJO28_000035 [Puccinia striiformis f. sp. tritici]|uniref:Glycoside hydrolase family 5 domain-containing protein n=2 Tax=Puccinia striiformis f. sp. tritici TaxID=168172 RepID=A0A0L0V5D3_9BASI|nr:hypothetical protein Pst134EA_001168 [Puccinia striiformis f. sp. tritici]KAI9626052.1 hypothetical protein H4Q26_016041 [Puccinia striiformis f. sp. tritici PST-130]KNE94421.1 hypothetical protein PSTG_12216 [Puccinia striiformis f. sp. tritici PST-78]KAH9467363.1 hypothetical protein Pst134EB_002381 [Puccinia striiformis f. sp. tritici]KAH9474125.1 hypothetical protein Pst134EA_001168 [Puccinia striiformis f. sp. tritici]KAI7961941.1 hypothetical protein MJO28_000035 [Puccinia striiformis
MIFSYASVSLASLVLLASQAVAKLPASYKYGTNLGGWLLSEPWMNPVEWAEIGGEYCPTDSASCAASEWGLARKLGQKPANEAFLKHWKSWFTQDHVNQLKALKLDHVRIPLGFWIVEELVEAPAELYAQGGWMELKRGLRQLQDAGFHVTLDMHALPGVSASNQMFAGNVTSDVQFYKDHNYQRALTWSAVLTSMSHLDPDFSSVVAIECINEPLSDASLTPGLEQYYSDFVTITRVIEFAIGVKCEADLRKSIQRLSQSKNALAALRAAIPLIVTYAGKGKVDVDPKVLSVLKSSLSNPSPVATAPASTQTGNTHAIPRSKIHPAITSQKDILRRRSPVSDGQNSQSKHKSCLVTVAMPKRWQWKGASNSMANHTLGPAAYDDHMYFAYGGVADPNLKSYLSTMCNQQHYQDARKIGETPYGHGEFSLANNFNATHDQLRQWGDAQRYIFNQEQFWTFWSFRLGKVMEPKLSQMMIESWSYLGAVEAGIWPKDPTDFYNPSICKPYLKSPGSAAEPVIKPSGQDSRADSGY